MACTLGVDDGGIQTPNGNGRFIYHVDDNQDDVLVIVVNLHLNRGQMGVQGAGSGAVLITHVGSPVATDGWLYFNGLPQPDAFSAIAGGFQRAATSPQRRPCGASHPLPCDTLLRLSQRCTYPAAQTRADREQG